MTTTHHFRYRIPRHRVRFPAIDPHQLAQDEAHFTLVEDSGKEVTIRFHDYAAIYERPGLYEQLFYERLKCQSPQKVVDILRYAMETSADKFSELRVLEFGAGNGMVGEELAQHGVARIVGVDIIEAAKTATDRDRPGVYDAYYVLELGQKRTAPRIELSEWRFNCLITVAALGFGDIPPSAFREAFNYIEDGGWIAFNIKETFLDNRDTSGFSVFIKNLILTEYLDLYHLERYQHRLSIDGRPLYYFGLAGRKNADIPESFMESLAR
jgi:predicted TPR repeat methyltransferase